MGTIFLDGYLTISICIIGVISNGAVAYIIITCKQFQASTYIFLCSMSIADVVALFSVALHVISMIIVENNVAYTAFLEFGCKAYGYMLQVGFTVSTHSLAIISIDRYFSICRNASLNRKYALNTNRKIKLTIIVTWSYALVSSLPNL
ncbi:uncharacterized protein TRIADDRAFT_33142, partial [Trichoplax adhaerens]